MQITFKLETCASQEKYLGKFYKKTYNASVPENLINILFNFVYLHEKSGLVRSTGLTMFNAFKRMFQPGV